jgi:hypothetical protein
VAGGTGLTAEIPIPSDSSVKLSAHPFRKDGSAQSLATSPGIYTLFVKTHTVLAEASQAAAIAAATAPSPNTNRRIIKRLHL